MGEELSIDMDVSQQHNSDVFLIDFVKFEELRNHMFTVEGHRQKAVFTVSIVTGICAQKWNKGEREQQLI